MRQKQAQLLTSLWRQVSCVHMQAALTMIRSVFCFSKTGFKIHQRNLTDTTSNSTKLKCDDRGKARYYTEHE